MARCALRSALMVAVLMHAAQCVPFGGEGSSTSSVGPSGRQRDLIVAVRSKASMKQFEDVWSAIGDAHEHLELDEVCAAFGPLTSSVDAVHVWAALHSAVVVGATR
jgi:hypothetical protein